MVFLSVVRAVVAFVALAVSVGAFAAASDEARHIREVMTKHGASFATSREAAVRQLNSILVTEYQGRGSIQGEADPTLRAAYEDGAFLLLNGQSISGGALVQYLRLDPAFERSPIGPAYARFLDAMLQPTADPDDFLHEYMERVEAVRPTIDGLPPEFQRPVELWVMGAIYDDKVAMEAGERALIEAGAIKELVDSVRELSETVSPTSDAAESKRR